MSDFLVTSCPVHGTKFCSDDRSQRAYRRLALQYVAAGEFGVVYDDGTESWACCTEMRVARDGEMA